MVTMADLQTPKKNTWCPGCGNFGVLMAFKRAIIELGLEQNQVVLVSGIGCHGKMVDYVNINGFHGIHGRVIPIATGIKLVNPKLTVVGFSGDADCYDEGFEHFSHAIRRNIDMTLIVHDKPERIQNKIHSVWLYCLSYKPDCSCSRKPRNLCSERVCWRYDTSAKADG